jgi:hypothetical protein
MSRQAMMSYIENAKAIVAPDPATEEAKMYEESLLNDFNKVPDPAGKLQGDKVGQPPPVNLSLNMHMAPGGRVFAEASREGSGAANVIYGSGQWSQSRPVRMA